MDLSALFISLRVAAVSTIFTAAIGVAFAYYMYKKGKKSGIIDSLITLPMVLPPTVIGFFLLVAFGDDGIGGMLKSIGLSVIFTVTGATIAAFIVSLPIMYKTALSAFWGLDREVLQSARTLGVSEKDIFFKVALPLCKNGVLAGVVLSFARAMGEFGATIMIAGNIPGKTQTISVKIYTLISAGNYDDAYIWVGIMAAVSLFFIILVGVLTKKDGGEVKNR